MSIKIRIHSSCCGAHNICKMDKFREVKPKSYPTELLEKDWSKRRCFPLELKQEHVDIIHDLEVREDDVWLVTLGKCGTTWMQELVWLVLNNFNFEEARKTPLPVRSPYLEIGFRKQQHEEKILKTITELKSPRFIKSHLPLPLLPAQIRNKRPKIIYVFRNPKDALLSFYHHLKIVGLSENVTLEEVLEQLLHVELKTERTFLHVLEFYALRNEPWIFYTSFERMKLDLRQVILDVCAFLEKSITEEQMQQMLQHLSFEEMKKNPQCNFTWESENFYKAVKPNIEKTPFIRKGKVGSHKEEMSPGLIQKFDEWIKDSLKPYNVSLDELLLLD